MIGLRVARTGVALFIAAWFAVPLVCAGSLSASGDETALDEIYTKAIYDAAIRRPSDQRTLTPIDARLPEVTVATLTTKKDDPVNTTHPFARTKGIFKLEWHTTDTGVLQQAAWVSLPAESRAACRGADDPVLTLEQILGMPPVKGDWEIVQFSVAPEHIFRPCASGPDITTTQCSFKLPPDFSSGQERTAVEKTQLFVFQQMWSSYIIGHPEPGYPFTAMGWTYNWNPDAKDHYGVSEYIVRQGAVVSDVHAFTPEEYCSST